MSSKSSVVPKSSPSSFVSQDLLAADQRDYLSLSNSTILVESASRDRNSGIQVSAPRPELTNQFWPLFGSIPASANPMVGTVDDIPQHGRVHFLVGLQTTEPRNVFVAQNQSIVLPILTQAADNVAIDYDFLHLDPADIPYQFSISELQIITDAIMDTATNISLSINDITRINSENMNKFRVYSNEPYTLTLPAEDDLFGYRQNPNAEDWWFEYPYTQGVQDGYWVEIRNLPLGQNIIHFTGTVNYNNILVEDYNNSGGIGDTPLESLLLVVRGNPNDPVTASYDVTYNVDVLSRPDFNAQLRMMG